MEVITRVKIKVSLIGQTNNKEGIRSCGGKHVLNMHHTCSRQQGQACMSRISKWKGSKKKLGLAHTPISYCLLFARDTPKTSDPKRQQCTRQTQIIKSKDYNNINV